MEEKKQQTAQEAQRALFDKVNHLISLYEAATDQDCTLLLTIRTPQGRQVVINATPRQRIVAPPARGSLIGGH